MGKISHPRQPTIIEPDPSVEPSTKKRRILASSQSDVAAMTLLSMRLTMPLGNSSVEERVEDPSKLPQEVNGGRRRDSDCSHITDDEESVPTSRPALVPPCPTVQGIDYRSKKNPPTIVRRYLPPGRPLAAPPILRMPPRFAHHK